MITNDKNIIASPESVAELINIADAPEPSNLTILDHFRLHGWGVSWDGDNRECCA